MAAPMVYNVSMFFKLEQASLTYRHRTEQNDISAGWSKLMSFGEVCFGKACTTPPFELNLGADNETLLIFKDAHNSHAAVRVYQDGLVTFDLQQRTVEPSQHSSTHIRSLEASLVRHLGSICLSHNGLHCPIRRGQPYIWPYAVSGDERLLEMDYNEIVYRVSSKYQEICVYRSPAHGNVLFLDGDVMLGESDLIYTHTLCRIGYEDYTDKTVLILGGGDGGILYELLKHQPRYVTLAEIDEEVIKTCRQYLRAVCGDCLDQMSGSNYQIILEDCITVLNDSIQRKTTYDYVINDLTEYPVNKVDKGYDYDFRDGFEIMRLSLQVLKPHGKILARGNCLGAKLYKEKIEQDITSLGCLFQRREVYVPSFHEIYCLYEIWRKGSQPESSSHINGFCSLDQGVQPGKGMKTRSPDQEVGSDRQMSEDCKPLPD